MLKKFKLWIFMIIIYVPLFTAKDGIKLSREIYEVCPYSNICNRTAERIFDVDGMIPCCSSCSCDEDCGLRLDCCFDYLDTYKLVERGHVACIDAQIVGKGSNKPYYYVSNGYYMIQICGKDKVDAQEDLEVLDECRLSDEYGNSLISPVSSLEDDSVYINEECAACNKVNISRIKKWNYLFLPESTQMEKTITFDIERHVVNKRGVIYYIPPREENWLHKRCFDEYVEVESCKRNDTLLYLCEQLHAPYQSFFQTMYKNVFCALCEGRIIGSLSKQCKLDQHRAPSFVTLTFLLNSAVIEASKLSDVVTVTNMVNSGKACPPGYTEYLKSMCLAIYCPEGMLRIGDTCSYFALRWFVPLLSMNIKLLPKQGSTLLISQLQTLGNKERTNPFTWLKLPCRKANITLLDVFYSSASLDSDREPLGNDTANFVTSFIVRIQKNVDMASGIDPSLAIPIFHKCARGNWKANIGKETFTFHAYFDTYSWAVNKNKHTLSKWSPDERWVERIARPVQYTLLSVGPIGERFRSSIRIHLKKPFFCELVRIPQSDVEIHFGEIRIISRNITVGTNEYLVNSPFLEGDPDKTDGNKTTFSVCINDFDPRYVGSSKDSIHAMSSAVTLFIGFIPIILCVYVNRFVSVVLFINIK